MVAESALGRGWERTERRIPMRIVIGIDDSPFSEAALDFVRKGSWPPETVVTVVSSVPLPVSVLSSTVPVTGIEVGAWLKELTELHTQWVASAVRTLQSAGLKTQSRVPQGDPRESLVKIAKEEDADLIVMGSHGRTGLDKLLLGSVASHVVAHAPCSVLVVKQKKRIA
jgi:nucleotide-binding universal stress UspA family protein